MKIVRRTGDHSTKPIQAPEKIRCGSHDGLLSSDSSKTAIEM